MNPPTVPASLCGHCQQLATLVCSECEDALAYESPATNTYYCSPECQTEGLSDHKNDCERLKMRKLLFRAGSILQDVFYGYREVVFDKRILPGRNKDGKKYFYKDFDDDMPHMATIDNVLVPFPTTHVSNTQEKRVILTFQSCDDALSWMHDLVKYFLQSTFPQIKELHFKLKNPKALDIWDIESGEGGGTDDHSVLKVRLKNTLDEWYILDFAGAQYGVFEPVIPAPDYETSHVRTTTTRVEMFGATKKRILEHAEDRTICGMKIATNQRTSMFLLKGAEEWEKEHSLKISALLRLKGGTFESKRTTLIADIQSWIVCCVEELRDDAKQIEAETQEYPYMPSNY